MTGPEPRWFGGHPYVLLPPYTPGDTGASAVRVEDVSAVSEYTDAFRDNILVYTTVFLSGGQNVRTSASAIDVLCALDAAVTAL